MLRLLAKLSLGASFACAPTADSQLPAADPVRYLAPGAQPVDAAAPARTYGVETLRSGKLDHVLHGVGPMWTPSEVDAYVDAFPRTPPVLVRMGIDLAPSERFSFEEMVEHLRGLIGHHPMRMPVLSISYRVADGRGNMRGLAEEVSSGEFDGELDQLVELVKNVDRAVFLRIAPEVNVPNVGHTPRAFVKSYRHIVEHFRAAGVENVIYMWNYKALRDHQPPVETWYPGDAWVDWWSIDVFHADLQLPELRDRVVDFLRQARARGKPVMIPEAAPNMLDLHDELTWRLWFQPFFDLIRRYPVIRAFCYSNRDFREHVGLEKWGDMRIEGTPMARLWAAQLHKSIYLHAQPDSRAQRPESPESLDDKLRARMMLRERKRRAIEGQREEH